MIMLKKILILIPILFLSLFFSFSTDAQVQNTDVVLSISPQYPRVGDEVTASVSSYVTDLGNARISWILNNNPPVVGIGRKTFSFTIGNTGFKTTLEARIETATGSLVDKTITISPADIDLLWQATDAYVPPFYRGKALPSSEGMIKVVAIPDSSDLGGLSYGWKEDNSSQPSYSGYGKDFYEYKNSYLEDSNTVETTVSDLLGNGVGSGRIKIIPGAPKIIFYQKDPLLGIRWENALTDNFAINPNGETIVAEPYFFSQNTDASNLVFNWFLNGEQTATPDPQNALSVKLESGKSGTAKIKVSINNIRSLFQGLDKEFNVNF
jgi:hypothetical protein